MNNKLTLKLFIKYLKKNGIYDIYLKCLTHDLKQPIEFITYTIKTNPKWLISNGFMWEKEHNVDWYHFHMIWCDLIDKQIKK